MFPISFFIFSSKFNSILQAATGKVARIGVAPSYIDRIAEVSLLKTASWLWNTLIPFSAVYFSLHLRFRPFPAPSHLQSSKGLRYHGVPAAQLNCSIRLAGSNNIQLSRFTASNPASALKGKNTGQIAMLF